MNRDNRLIINGEIVTNNGTEKRDILISEGRITKIFDHSEGSTFIDEDCEIIDAKNKYIFPGLINTHTHLFQTLFKGRGRDLKLIEWLNASIRPNLSKLLPKDFYWATMLGLMDAVQSGTTTVLDYMYANSHEESSEYVIKAYEDIGVRGMLARGWSDKKKGFEIFDRTVENTETVLGHIDRLVENHANDMMGFALAPTAIWNMSKEGLETASDYANEKNMIFTMHINETEDDNRNSVERFGKKVVPFLHDIGCINDRFLGVHCVDLDNEDIRILADSSSSISYNPLSNMILGSGIAPIPEMLSENINIALATDGAASNDAQDMLEVLKTSNLLLKATYKDPCIIKATDTFKMATTSGAKALGYEKDIGNIEVGKKADLFIYNPETAKTLPVYNPITSLIYSSDKENIDEVIIDGITVYRKGGWTRIDWEKVCYEVKKIALRLV